MSLDKKADILYLIMGTNPFPNLISAITRSREDGIIICICTENTKNEPYNRFKKAINNKIKNIRIKYLIVQGFDRNSIRNVIETDLESKLCKAKNEISIELNYTGGTKVMSSAGYETISNYRYDKNDVKPNVILSYIDSEREKVYYEYKKNSESRFKNGFMYLRDIDTDYEYTVFDIINAYNIDLKNEAKITTEVRMKDLSMAMGNLFCDINKRTYDNHISFIRETNNILNDIENIKSRNKYAKNISKEQIFKTSMDKLLSDKSIHFKYKKCDDFGFSNDKALYKYFKGTKWLEEYIFSIFLNLKDEGVLDDVVANYEKKRNIKENNFEVDIVAYKKYKLYAVSITSASKKKYAWGKMYEIKQRAKDLAGDEAAMCYINLCWDANFLKDEAINIWDNLEPKNLLILGAKSFGSLKEELKNWITRSETVE